MAKLVCQAGPSAGHEYPLNKDKVLFGRQRTCDVQIMDSMASREHFLVRKDGSLFTVVDLESRNGTHLNDRKVTERQVDFGDVIRVGSVEYLLVKEDGDTDLKDLLTKKYAILEKIGEGGMGIVYKAMQKSMERTVALKILAPKYSARPRFVEQFIREARAAGALNHPNIIQVHDVASENGVHYFSMEFIDGPTAMRMLRTQGALPPAVALEIIRQTAKALAYAHDHRIIHRDIKPDNIMVTTNNTVKLADLGISKTFDEAEAEGKPKRIVGTPHYMAPEASLGNRIDHRVDIYSLGVTLYQLLSDRTPFSGSKATDVLKAHIKEEAPSLGSLVPNLPAGVEELVNKMMAKEPDDRLQSAEAVASEVQNLLEAQQGGAGAAGKGQETVMLRKMVSSTAQAGPSDGEQGQPSNPTVGGSQATARQKTRTQESGQGSGTSPQQFLRPIINLAIALLIIILGFVLFRQLVQATQDPPVEEVDSPPSGQALAPQEEQEESPLQQPGAGEGEDRSPSQVGENHAAAVNDMSTRLATANTPAELALFLEDLAQVQRRVDDQALRIRLKGMEEAATSRMHSALAAQERSRFATLESEVSQLLEASDFATASSRLEAFSAEHDEQIIRRKEMLLDRISGEQERYLGTLERRIDRYTVSRDVESLREIRDSLPQSLLNHPLAQKIATNLRQLESAQLESQRAITQQAQRLLLAMSISEMQMYVRQQRERTQQEDFREQLQELSDLGSSLLSSFEHMQQHIKAQERPPRYRGSLRGMNNPDLVGTSTNGLLVSVPSGGQATIPWRDLDPEVIPEVLTLASPKDHAESIKGAFQRWVELVDDIRP